MSYTQKHYREIFLKDLEESLEAGLISHEEEFEDYIKNRKDISNFHVMNLSIEAQRIDYTYDDMTQVYNSNKVNLADNSDLDEIGDIVNCPRPQATRAGVLVTFYLPNDTSSDITIPAGVELIGKSGVVYITDEELYFKEGSNISTAYAYAKNPGVTGKIIENELTTITTNLSQYYTGNITCSNLTSSSGGYEAYTDDEYRLLIKKWIDSNQKGNYWSFVKFFNTVEGIDGYKIVPNWDGSGTVKIIVDPGDVYTLRTIYDLLNDNVTQIDDVIYLTAPEKVYIDVYASVNIDLDVLTPFDIQYKEDVQYKLVKAVRLFIEGGYRNSGVYYPGLSIGEDFIPHKLQVFLDEEIPELKSIEFNYPSKPVVVNDEEQCFAREISIIME